MSVSTFKVVLCTAGLSKAEPAFEKLPVSHMEGFWNKQTKWQSSNNNTILNPSPFFLPLQSNSRNFLDLPHYIPSSTTVVASISFF